MKVRFFDLRNEASRLLRPIMAVLVLLASLGSGMAQVRLVPIKAYSIAKDSGGIDQLVVSPEGNFLVRDSDFRNEAAQAIEIYDREGRFVRRIGSFGKSPGQYYRLKAISLGRDGAIWAADIAGRLSRFSQDGKLLNTRLIQKPAFRVYGLCLDEPRGVFYLTGCVAKAFYLDDGCRLVHQYSLHDGAYQRSWLQTDPEAIQKRLLALEDYHVDAEENGFLWAADGPIRKVFRIDPWSGSVQQVRFRSRIIPPVPALNPKQIDDIMPIYENTFLIDRLLVCGGFVVVSVSRRRSSTSVLQVFNTKGLQVGSDLRSPGRLVGRSRSGTLFFARKVPAGFEIVEHRIE